MKTRSVAALAILATVVALVGGMGAGCSPQKPDEKPDEKNQEKARVAHPLINVGPAYTATIPAFHEGTEARHERFNAISKEGSAKLVFLGDSITEGWEGAGAAAWEKYYGPATGRHAANFGIGGDRTEHVLWRLEHGNFDGLNPKLIVVMIGTNNAGHRKDPAPETAQGVSRIVFTLLAKCPESKILLLGIFPRGDKFAQLLCLRYGEVGRFVAIFREIVELPGFVLGRDRFPFALTHRLVSFVIPPERFMKRLRVLGENGHEAFAGCGRRVGERFGSGEFEQGRDDVDDMTGRGADLPARGDAGGP